LDNVYSFYEMYSQGMSVPVKNFVPVSTNILDQWISIRLAQVVNEVTKASDKYELDRAVRPFADFVDDLSTWYLRRSRDRFKSGDKIDKVQAIETTRFILEESAKLIAPVMPFYAEELYQKVKSFAGAESVHLASWPDMITLSEAQNRIILNMVEVRKVVSLGLEARSKANIKVRQPLQKLKLQDSKFNKIDLEQYFSLIKDEINVKEIEVDNTITEAILLDLNLTPELKEEGIVRELTRGIQDLRKQEKLTPTDLVSLKIQTNQAGMALVNKFSAEIKKTTLVKEISFTDFEGVNSITIDGLEFKLKVSR
jgi:isoleucyl-tRNA synthetase